MVYPSNHSLEVPNHTVEVCLTTRGSFNSLLSIQCVNIDMQENIITVLPLVSTSHYNIYQNNNYYCT